MTQTTGTHPTLLVCERWGQAAMGLWADSDACPSRRCDGRLVAQAGTDGHNGAGTGLETTVPLVEATPLSLDGEGEAETLDAFLEPVEACVRGGTCRALRQESRPALGRGWWRGTRLGPGARHRGGKATTPMPAEMRESRGRGEEAA